ATAAAAITNYRDPLFSAYPNSTAFPSIYNLWNTTTGGNAQWPSEGWSGLELYNQTLIPGWSKSLVAASLKWGRLVRLRLNAAGTQTAPTNTAADTTSYFGSINRFRDLAVSPDGKDFYVVMDRSTSTSGPSALNPVVAACAGCLQKYTFLGYNDNAGKSDIPTTIPVSSGPLYTCIPSTTITIDNVNSAYWVPITGPDGNILAEINSNGQTLGTITTSFFRNGSPIRVNNGVSYLDRNFAITPQFQPASAVKIRLYITKAEFDVLDADPLSQVTALSDLRIYKNNDICRGHMIPGSVIITPTSAEAFGTDAYVLQANISSFSSFFIAASSLALSSRSISFTGTFKNETSYLKWETQNELNYDHYVVERSIDNISFAALGKVTAKGTTEEKNRYTYNDAEAGRLGVAKIYYRLRIVNQDGSYAYSNIVVVDVPGGLITRVTVFPNPAESQTTIMIVSANEQLVKWKLIDVTGRQVLSSEAILNKGENRIRLNLGTLKKGTYFLQLNGQYISA
ncbi:MAG: T9SS type A sorting domain-containing protein, partial [Pedobacter sp.]